MHVNQLPDLFVLCFLFLVVSGCVVSLAHLFSEILEHVQLVSGLFGSSTVRSTIFRSFTAEVQTKETRGTHNTDLDAYSCNVSGLVSIFCFWLRVVFDLFDFFCVFQTIFGQYRFFKVYEHCQVVSDFFGNEAV